MLTSLEKLDGILFSLQRPLVLLIIFSVMAVIGLVALGRKALDGMGTAFAVLFGFCVFYLLRLEGFLLFLSFFISSILIGKLKGGKGETRSFIQVSANGLLCVLAAFMYFFSGREASLVMFASCIAESTSDTWAGDIGRLSARKPFSILTFKTVDEGLSGGVTLLGFAGGAFGSLFISILYRVFFSCSVKAFLIVFVCGFSGCVADSILGASVQALYYDRESGKYTEDSRFEHVRGLVWVDNSMVNFLSNLLSAAMALGLSFLLV